MIMIEIVAGDIEVRAETGDDENGINTCDVIA